MFYIDTSRNGTPVYDALVNQSLDNYLVNDLKIPGHGLILYINQPAVIVGINQNVTAEVDFRYLTDHQVQLVRRTSGGGAVYHDTANLIFENIINGDPRDGSKFGDYAVFAQPIIRALKEMGVSGAELSGKSNLVVDGGKFSGMTMFKNGDGYAAGGTLMYDLNVDAAHQVLLPDQHRHVIRGVQSNRVPITNLRQYLAPQYQGLSTEAFKQELLKHIFQVTSVSEIETVHLTDHDWAIIDQRLEEKYATDAWNYGANPGFKEYRALTTPTGRLHLNLTRRDGVIKAIALFGDVETGGDLQAFSAALVGTPLTVAQVHQALRHQGGAQVLPGLDLETLAQFIVEAPHEGTV